MATGSLENKINCGRKSIQSWRTLADRSISMGSRKTIYKGLNMQMKEAFDLNACPVEQEDSDSCTAYNICFQGASLDVGNRGCRALAASFITLALNVKPNAKIFLLYGNRTGGTQQIRISNRVIDLEIVNCRLSLKAKINEHVLWILLMAVVHRFIPNRWVRSKLVKSNRWLSTLAQAHFVGEIRGGDSLSDLYGLRRFVLGAMPCLVAVLMQKRLVLLPQTYGPFRSVITRAISRFIVRRANRVFARDTESVQVIKELLGADIGDTQVDFCPDLAFMLEPELPHSEEVKVILEHVNSSPLIGVNISGLLYVGGYTRKNMFGLRCDYKKFVEQLLHWLMKNTNAHVLLVPHLYGDNDAEDERVICSNLVYQMEGTYGNRLHTLRGDYNQSQVKAIIGLCCFFIGSRMHACIAALSQAIPAIGLAYSRKFAGVFRSVGVEHFAVDMCRTDEKDILAIIGQAFERRHEASVSLAEMMPKIRERIITAMGAVL